MTNITMVPRCLMVAVVFTACSSSSAPARDEKAATVTLSGDRSADEATLRRLRDEARALARTNGCSEGATCKSAPMGSKACGGPWSYIVYCSLTTDEPALLGKLDQLARFESEYNRKYEVVSTCELISAPRVESVNGECRVHSSDQ